MPAEIVKGNQYSVVLLDELVVKVGCRAAGEHSLLFGLKESEGYFGVFPKSYGSFRAFKTECCIQERIRGPRLAEVMKRPGELKALTPDRIGVATVEWLYNLGEHGIQHRDIRPENIIVGSPVRLYLIDFGWAIRDGDDPEAPKTLGGAYRSPEGPDDEWACRKLCADYQALYGKAK